MNCPQCGTPFVDASNYCPKCCMKIPVVNPTAPGTLSGQTDPIHTLQGQYVKGIGGPAVKKKFPWWLLLLLALLLALLLGTGIFLAVKRPWVSVTLPPVSTPNIHLPDFSDTPTSSDVPVLPDESDADIDEPIESSDVGASDVSTPRDDDGIYMVHTVPFYENRYYLSRLVGDDLEEVKGIYRSLMDFDESYTPYTQITIERFEKLVLMLYMECPELFQADLNGSFQYWYDENGYVTKVIFPYRYDEPTYREMRGEIEQRIMNIVSSLELSSASSEAEIEDAVFSMLGQSIHYNMDAEHAGLAYGALVDWEAKCDGISFAYKWILEYCGMQCLVVDADEPGQPIGHAWNIVRLNGDYHHVDVTSSVRNGILAEDEVFEVTLYYGAFNASDSLMHEYYVMRDHFESIVATPKCTDEDKAYYRQNGCYIPQGGSADEMIYEAMNDSVTYNGYYLHLQFADDKDQKKCIDSLGGLANQWATENGVGIYYNYVFFDHYHGLIIKFQPQ